MGMTDPRLTKQDPTGANRAAAPLHSRVDYIECVKCGRVMREDRFVAHMQQKHLKGATR
jgi:ribosomal protein S26